MLKACWTSLRMMMDCPSALTCTMLPIQKQLASGECRNNNGVMGNMLEMVCIDAPYVSPHFVKVTPGWDCGRSAILPSRGRPFGPGGNGAGEGFLASRL